MDVTFMNCSQAQDQLFAAEALGPQALDAELAAHVAQCQTCGAMLAKLRRLEQAAGELPPAEGSFVAQQGFLSRLQNAPQIMTPAQPAHGRTTHHWLRSAVVSAPRMALAASVLLAVALVLWLLGPNAVQTASASDAIVDQLVDLDVRLASAESLEERGQIFSLSVGPLRAAIDRGSLAHKDRELAQKLLDTGTSLARNSDPLNGAQGFADVADLLLKRMKAASAAKDVHTLRRLSQNYALVASSGLNGELARAQQINPARTGKKEHDTRLEQMLQQDAQLRIRLEQLLEESPDATRKEIYKALKIGKAPRKQGQPAKTPKEVWSD
jgi:hypothetical protein